MRRVTRRGSQDQSVGVSLLALEMMLYLIPYTATEALAPSSHEPSNSNSHRGTANYDDEDADDADELAPVQRLPAVTLQLWGSLLKARGYEVSHGGVMLSPGKAREMVVQGREEHKDETAEDSSGSVLTSFRRANSYVAPRTTAVPAPRMSREPSSAGASAGAGPNRLPFGREGPTDIPSVGVAGPSSRAKRLGDGDVTEDTNLPPAQEATPVDEPSTIFAGLKFLLRGETDTATVRGAIEGAGGTVVSQPDADADYVIVRLVRFACYSDFPLVHSPFSCSGSALYRAESCPLARARYRTECWLERCLFADFLCAPDVHVSFVPLGVRLPIPGACQFCTSVNAIY
jgi:DNA replication regulator DPB11